MTLQSLLTEPDRVDEPHAAQEFSDVLTQVAAEGKALILRRNGADLAAVIPMEQLDLVRELLARQEAEKLAAQIDWGRARSSLHPPQQWFDDTDNPFEPAWQTVPSCPAAFPNLAASFGRKSPTPTATAKADLPSS